MWTDAKSRELIATEYPWFLNTFDNYSQPIQRADAIRYFVLAHFGGIYIDLDDVCTNHQLFGIGNLEPSGGPSSLPFRSFSRY